MRAPTPAAAAVVFALAAAGCTAPIPVEDPIAALADPGMHTTATIDFEVVLAGNPVLELDDGAEVTLAPGDTVVQNGTRHRWHNRGTEPATMAVFIVGAHHDRVG